MKKNTRKAFTLAEVLISLTIIGVIAAITVPALIQRTNKQEYVSALQKTYSTLSQAVNQIIAEEGIVMDKASQEGWAYGSIKEIRDLFAKKLNTAKICDNVLDCFPQSLSKTRPEFKRLHGDNIETFAWQGGSASNWAGLVLADGAQVLFNNGWFNTEWKFAAITVDINGAKGPNLSGRDIFLFGLNESGFYPFNCSTNNNCPGNGWGNIDRSCACKVLSEGAMNY